MRCWDVCVINNESKLLFIMFCMSVSLLCVRSHFNLTAHCYHFTANCLLRLSESQHWDAEADPVSSPLGQKERERWRKVFSSARCCTLLSWLQSHHKGCPACWSTLTSSCVGVMPACCVISSCGSSAGVQFTSHHSSPIVWPLWLLMSQLVHISLLCPLFLSAYLRRKSLLCQNENSSAFQSVRQSFRFSLGRVI